MCLSAKIKGSSSTVGHCPFLTSSLLFVPHVLDVGCSNCREVEFKLLLMYISLMAKDAEYSSHLLATSSFTFELFVPSTSSSPSFTE